MDELKKEEELEVSQDQLESKEEESKVVFADTELSNVEDDDDFETETDEGLLTGVRYDTPDTADKFIDMKDGTVIDKKNLTPFQIIKAIAEQNGTKIQEPSKGCHHCYGRGYEGIDSETDMPIPCRCIFRGRTENEKSSEQLWDSGRLNGKMNREQRRRITKLLARQFKRQRKLIKNKANDEVVDELDENAENELINKVLKKYVKLQSIKKTAKELSMTLTAVNKIIDSNREKLEKLKNKTKE